MEVQSPIFFEVGRVKDAHGLKGELFVRLFAGRADWLNNFKAGYLVSPEEDEIQQFEVEEVSPHKDGLIIKLGLNDRTGAEQLKGYSLKIAADMLVASEGEDFYLCEVMGFEVLDTNTQKKSTVVGISSNGYQDILELEHEGGLFMVPFVKPLIEKVDFEARQIRMQIPIGLLGEIVPAQNLEELRKQ
jgi:16S rRNA processing protein RimM